jgi:gas vesicle protein
MKNTGKILLALTCGAAIGAALGVLFAPGKGSETRKKLSDTASDWSDQLLKMKDKYMTNSNGKTQTGRKVNEPVS